MGATKISASEPHVSNTGWQAAIDQPAQKMRAPSGRFRNAPIRATAAGMATGVGGVLATFLPIANDQVAFYMLSALAASGFGAGAIFWIRWWRTLSENSWVYTSATERRSSMSLPLSDGQEDRDSVETFTEKVLAQHPARLAAALEMATRGVGAQGDAMKQQLQSAADGAAALLRAQTQAFTERLGGEQAKLTEALDLYGQSIASRLNLASVSLAREFRDSGDQLQKRLESTSESAVVAISRQGESTALALEKAAQDIEHRLTTHSRETLALLEAIGAQTAQAIDAQSREAVRRIVEATTQASDRAQSALSAQIDDNEERQRSWLAALDESGRLLSERSASATVAMEMKLKEATGAIDRMVEVALKRIETGIDRRLTDLSTRLSEVEQGLDEQWTLRRNGLTSEFAAAATQAYSQVASEVERAAGEAARATKLILTQGVSDATGRLAEAAEIVMQRMETTSAKSAATFADGQVAVTAQIEALDSKIAIRLEDTAKSLATLTGELNAVLEIAERTVAEKGRHLVEALGNAAKDLDESTAANLKISDAHFDAWRNSWEEFFQNQCRVLDYRTNASAKRLQSFTESCSSALSKAMETHHAALDADLTSALSSLQDTLSERESIAVENFAGLARKFSEQAVDGVNDALFTLASQGENLRARLEAERMALLDALQTGSSQTEARFRDSLSALTQTIEALAARIEAGLDQRSQSLAKTLAGGTQSLLQSLSSGANDARSSIESAAAQAAQVIATGQRTIVQSLSQSAEQNSTTLVASLASSQRELETRLSDAVRQFGDAKASLVTSVEHAATAAGRVIEERRLEATRGFEAGAEQFAQLMESGRARLLDAFAGLARDALQSLLRSGDESRRAIEAELEKTSSHLESSRSDVLNATATATEIFVRTVSEHLTKLQNAMEEGASRLNKEFASPFNETLARIQSEGSELAAATRALAESIVKTSAAHREHLRQAFAREADALAATVASNAETFRRDFEESVSNADQVFLSRGYDLAKTLEERINNLRGVLDGEALAFLRALETRGDQLSQQVDVVSQRSIGDFERKAVGLIALLTRRGDDLLSAMTAAASESARKVALLTQELDSKRESAQAMLPEIDYKIDALKQIANKNAAKSSPTSGDEGKAASEFSSP